MRLAARVLRVDLWVTGGAANGSRCFRLLAAGSPEAPAPPVPAPDTLPAPLATRYRAATPTEGASPRGQRRRPVSPSSIAAGSRAATRECRLYRLAAGILAAVEAGPEVHSINTEDRALENPITEFVLRRPRAGLRDTVAV